MADLDTQSKRMSGINPASPWRGTAKAPTGSFTQGERQAVSFMYSGILASSASSVIGWIRNTNLYLRRRR